MSFKPGDFFPKKAINELSLSLNDPRWAELEGGYRRASYDASIVLKKLELANTVEEANEVYEELWDNLHHQGDVGIASYYAVPHMIRIAKEKNIIDHNVLGLVSLIEIQRHKNNPTLPSALYPAYSNALHNLSELAIRILPNEWNFDITSAALTAIAVAKGQIKLANAIQNLDSEDKIDEFLESY